MLNNLFLQSLEEGAGGTPGEGFEKTNQSIGERGKSRKGMVVVISSRVISFPVWVLYPCGAPKRGPVWPAFRRFKGSGTRNPSGAIRCTFSRWSFQLRSQQTSANLLCSPISSAAAALPPRTAGIHASRCRDFPVRRAPGWKKLLQIAESHVGDRRRD